MTAPTEDQATSTASPAEALARRLAVTLAELAADAIAEGQLAAALDYAEHRKTLLATLPPQP